MAIRLRRWLRIGSFVLALFVGLLVVAIAATQTAWFRDWLRRYVVREADDYLNATLAIERLEGNVFTGDTLFRNSVGGVRAPGHTTYADLRSSIMDTLMALPKETIVRPGHTEPSTVGEEWESNGFIRIWRGLDPEGDAPCTALGQQATLILLGDDYDGGHKAWVRWPDGRDDIVPGSRVERG
jgi:hypothetical protein